MKKTPFVFIVAFVMLLLPYTVFAAGNVPQKILDLRSSIVRVVCDVSDGYSMGTGFALGSGGPVQYIATNNHVVEGNTGNIKIWYGNQTFINATIAAQKPDSDVCVLKLDDPVYNMTPLTLDTRGDAKTGDDIYTLGFPGSADVFSNDMSANAEEVTVTDGIISSIKSASITQNGNPVKLYQINAAINHGNSGGPLMNSSGEVIGINSFGVEGAQNTNAAISINELTDLLKQNSIPYKTDNVFWIIIIAAAAAAGVVVLAVLFKKRMLHFHKKTGFNNVPLETWLQNAGGKVPFETAVFMLTPVLRKLLQMHANGICHLDISPDKITVNETTQRATLLEPGKKEINGYLVLTRPGFSAPEQYRASGNVGAWSDIYAIGAVLYRMVFGYTPPEALARMENDSVIETNISKLAIEDNKKAAWLDALNLTAEKRISDCRDLARDLWGLSLSDPLKTPENFSNEPQKYAHIRPEKKFNFKFKKKWRPLYIIGIFAVAAGCYFGWVEYSYEQIVQSADNGDYTRALANMIALPVFYRDTNNLYIYISAGVYMQRGDFDQAYSFFSGLGDYRNSRDMLNEVVYQRARNYLRDGNYNQAKPTFVTLDNYKDSKTMVQETDYQKAQSKLKSGQYEEAITLFKSLGSYKDSQDMALKSAYLEAQNFINNNDVLRAYQILKNMQNYPDVSSLMPQLKEAVYNKGVQLYESGSQYPSQDYFYEVSGYSNADKYLKLIHARFTYNEDEYQQLIQLAGFEDAVNIIMNDTFIYYYLKGNWSDGGNYYFKLMDKGGGSWQSSYNLPWYNGDYFTITQGVYKIGNKGYNYVNEYKFTFVSSNEMIIYCYKNNRMYEMFRE